ncbi:MAG: hypothetical protein ACR2KL_09610 [Nocardioidaceae bacterium]
MPVGPVTQQCLGAPGLFPPAGGAGVLTGVLTGVAAGTVAALVRSARSARVSPPRPGVIPPAATRPA